MLTRSLSYKQAALLAIVVLTGLVLWHAKVTADPYFTFRTIDNFIHGYGLRWNIDERAQGYTHPLWMLIHIPFYALWDNIFLITIAISAVCVIEALLVISRSFNYSTMRMLCLLMVPLATSRTFIKFSTSGLENPLMYVLFAGFVWAILHAPQKTRWFWMSLFASLCMLNRLDMATFFVPIGLWFLAHNYREIRFKQCIIGQLPIVLWLLFSLVYYGTLYPMTKFAKLDTGVSKLDYIVEGFRYLGNLIVIDFSSGFFLLIACAAPLVYLCIPKFRTSISLEMAAIPLGILGYTLYVIYVGGDYIFGRYWSLPVFASIWWVYGVAAPKIPQKIVIAIAVLLIAQRIFYPSDDSFQNACPVCFSDKILADEGGNTLLSYITAEVDVPQVTREGQKRTIVSAAMAISAFNMGPNVHDIDREALADPLLARLPADVNYIRQIGHFSRVIPNGYAHATDSGSLDQMPPPLAEYYSHLRLIIAGDLWSWERFKTIIRFNLGEYDSLREEYEKTLPPRKGPRMINPPQNSPPANPS